MRALVISGGGSKGAFAGGVAEYLIDVAKHDYKLFVGSSTGSLLISQLALGNTQKIKHIYTNVSQSDIFSLNPFITRKQGNREYVTINYLNTVIQFIKRKRTFGESKNLKKTIYKHFTRSEFDLAQCCGKDLVVTVSNLTKNKIEYKSIHDFSYHDFIDWIWMSSNLVPFMSLATKNGFEYADGGFGSVMPLREAVRRGATEIDAIILEAENMEHNKVLGKNPFSLMMNLFGFMLDQVGKNNVREGKLAALQKNVKLNLYYTPSQLTENSLIFNKKIMSQWWKDGFDYAMQKGIDNKLVLEDSV